jgi:tetratricopeptide (TPR) repeat protein
MVLRITTGPQRAGLLIACCACCIFLGFFSIRAALADYFLSEGGASGFERAAALEPANPDNWYALGRYWQYNLEDPDPARALAAYRASLAIDPLSSDAWLDLGTLLESEGDIAEARAAFGKAKQVYPSSAEVTWRYGNFLLRQGELDPAFSEIRKAVVSEPSRGPEAFSRAVRLEPDVNKVLDLAIPRNQSVYIAIMRGLADQNQPDDALEIWKRLPGGPLSLQDVQPLVGRLREHRRYEEAFRIWDQAARLAGFTGLEPNGSILWDGGFESGVVDLSYAWRYLTLSRGVEIWRDSSEKHSGRSSLRLSFPGQSNLSFHDVCHTVVVEPNTGYLLTAWVKTRDLTSDEGVRIELGAVHSRDLVVSSAALGSGPWSEIRLPWVSPAEAREAQVCLVRNPSAAPDNQIRGTFWIDDVSLVRASDAPGAGDR